MVTKSEVAAAVNYLIQSDQCSKFLREITNIIERWDTHPMVYAGSLTVLNPMIDVGVQSREAFERLVELIEDKRKLLPTLKRVDYQRELMARRRARLAKGVEIEQLSKPRKTFTKEDKRKLEEQLQDVWRKERDMYVAQQGDLSWHERNEAVNKFWDMLDARLDEQLSKARRTRRSA